MKLKGFLLGLTFGISSASSFGSDGVRLSELYKLALDNDPQLKIAASRIERAEASQDNALSSLLPQITANAQLNLTDYSSQVTQYQYTGERYSVGLSQALIDISSVKDIERAEWDVLLEKANLEYTLQDRTAIFVERFFAVLQAQSKLDISLEELEVTEQNLERIQSLEAKRLVSKVAYLESVAERDQILADISQLQADLSLAKDMLAESVGDAAYGPILKVESLESTLDIDLRTLDEWKKLSLADSPLMASNNARIESATAALEAAESERLPKLSLRLTAQQTNIGSEFSQSSFNTANVISLNLSAPLFLGGSEFAKIRSQESLLSQTRHEAEINHLRVLREVKTAYLNTRALLASYDAAKAAVNSANLALDAAEKSFNFGVTDVVTLRKNVSRQFNAYKRMNDVVFRTLSSYVSLLRWAGQLNVEDIEQLDMILAG